MPKYYVGEIDLRDIFLVFKTGNLILIELNNDSKLTKAGIEKYKPTEKLDTSYKIKCTYVVSGVTEEKRVTKESYTWIYNDSKVESISISDYDQKCKEVFVNYMRFAINDAIDFIIKTEQFKKDKMKKEFKKEVESVKDEI